MTESKIIFTDLEFAQLGEGRVAYLKRVKTDELAEKFPSLPPMTPGIEVWGLFGAAGEPIVLSDVRAQALAGAQEHELETVTLQ
ncbi:MAG: putative small protein [Candidatus Tokpelaia sp. JSC085]|nr:MAG: putative small protein [Candidatus Tokpelaia sp. JSC085]